VRSMGRLRERGSLVRRDGDALGGSLDQLGHVLVVILANNMTARQALATSPCASNRQSAAISSAVS